MNGIKERKMNGWTHDGAIYAKDLEYLNREHVKKLDHMLVQHQEGIQMMIFKSQDLIAQSVVHALRAEMKVMRSPPGDSQPSGSPTTAEPKTNRKVEPPLPINKLGPLALPEEKERTKTLETMVRLVNQEHTNALDPAEDVWRESHFRADDWDDVVAPHAGVPSDAPVPLQRFDSDGSSKSGIHLDRYNSAFKSKPSMNSSQSPSSIGRTNSDDQVSTTVDQMMSNLNQVRKSVKDGGCIKSIAAPTSKSLEQELIHLELGSTPARERAEAKSSIKSSIYTSSHSVRVISEWRKLVHHPYVSNSITVLIIMNAFLIGIQTEWASQNVGKEDPGAFEILGLLFTVAFILELLLRLASEGREFFMSKEWKWNIFDLVIVISGVLEIILGLINTTEWKGGTALRALRMLRLVRTIRAIRVMQCFRELRLVVYGIMNSIVSLLWLCLLLVFIMFIFGVYITQMVVEKRKTAQAGPADDQELLALLELNYGSMAHTFYTLFAAIAGGVSWIEVSTPLFHLSPLCGFLFVVYIAFVVFAVLNVVTGVFVDNAHKAAESDVDHVVLEETAKRQKNIEAVQRVFLEADSDRSGELSRTEFEAHVTNPLVQAYFQMINLDFESFGADRLFNLLDFDGGGNVDVNEFVIGCTKLRGLAKSLDMAMLHHDVRKLLKLVRSIEEQSWSTERRILEALGVSILPGN